MKAVQLINVRLLESILVASAAVERQRKIKNNTPAWLLDIYKKTFGK